MFVILLKSYFPYFYKITDILDDGSHTISFKPVWLPWFKIVITKPITNLSVYDILVDDGTTSLDTYLGSFCIYYY